MKKLALLSTAVFLMTVGSGFAADMKAEIPKIGDAYCEHFNKQDAAAITSLFTKNYLRVTQNGVQPDNTKLYEGTEPPRVCRRLFGLSYAAMAACSSMA